MPVFKSGNGLAPEWCEMEYFDILHLPAGARHRYERTGAKEKLVVGKGRCRIRTGDQVFDAEERANLDLTAPDDRFEIEEVAEDVTLIRMCGRWGDETGGSGLFAVDRTDKRKDRGDPVSYTKETSFDSHFHDCDEYWIIFEGYGIAVSEGKCYEVGPGDCVATGMGHHHDFPQVDEPVKAVYFETTMEGRKRPGHLWTHTHGPAEPKPERA